MESLREFVSAYTAKIHSSGDLGSSLLRALPDLDRRIKQVKRTFTRKDNPEGAAALRSLRAVREEVAGARESLLPTRFYVLLYAERARNLSELKQSVEVLDEQCERVVSAIRQIPGANADREEPEAL